MVEPLLDTVDLSLELDGPLIDARGVTVRLGEPARELERPIGRPETTLSRIAIEFMIVCVGSGCVYQTEILKVWGYRLRLSEGTEGYLRLVGIGIAETHGISSWRGCCGVMEGWVL